MKSRTMLPALVAVGLLCLASASSASAFELLNRMVYGGGSCGCDAAPTCGCDNGCDDGCCKTRCRKERCHHHRNRCCDNSCGCEVTCAAPAPKCGCDVSDCCQPKCREPRCCRERCRHHRCHRDRCGRGCCDNSCGCEPSCGAPAPKCGCGAY